MNSTPAPRLVDDGDSLEMLWGVRILTRLPEYEILWQRHIVPLTFRDAEDAAQVSKFLRPRLPSHLRDLADSHYIVFHHLAQCLNWIKHIREVQNEESSRIREFPTVSEALYCFLAHIVSATDSVLYFAHAVNEVLDKYGENPCFEIQWHKERHSHERYPQKLKNQKHLSVRAYNEFIKKLKRMRNGLMHQKLVFVQNTNFPRPHYFPKYAGLAGIAEMALAGDRITEHFEPIDSRLEEFVDELMDHLGPIWRVALGRLDAIKDPQYGHEQRRYSLEAKTIVAADLSMIRDSGS